MLTNDAARFALFNPARPAITPDLRSAVGDIYKRRRRQFSGNKLSVLLKFM
jgi:hypothetical protein